MPLPPRDFAKLRKMQRLCTALETDHARVAAFNDYIVDVTKRHAELNTLYADWQRLTESRAFTAAQKQQIEAMVPEGAYSILGQDTIWNALSDLHVEYVRLLKTIAKAI